jgi:hypothetical protein
MPKKDRADLATGPNAIVCPETTGAHNNGQGENSQHEIRRGPIIKIVRYGNMTFTTTLQATVRDHRLSPGARWLLIFLLSQPKGWQPLKWRIEKETGQSSYKLKGWMRELRKYGYGRVVLTPKGQRWEVCEFPNQVWLEAQKARGQNFTPEKSTPDTNDRAFKNDGVSSSNEEQATASCCGASAAAQPVVSASPLAEYSEENQEKIALWHEEVCNSCRYWLRINKFTEAVPYHRSHFKGVTSWQSFLYHGNSR